MTTYGAKRQEPAGSMIQRIVRIWQETPISLSLEAMAFGHTSKHALISKRVFDITVASALLTILMPLFGLLALVRGGKVFESIERLGWCGIPFTEIRIKPFHGKLDTICQQFGVYRLASLWNVLGGEMSLVGPRVVCEGELNSHQYEVWIRQSARPGLICLWWVRKRANISFETELSTDLEYVECISLKRDLGIALRAVPALLFGGDNGANTDEVAFLGVQIDNLTMAEAVDSIVNISEAGGSRHVAFVNADCYNIARKNPEYKRILQRSDITLADGIGVKIAGKLLRQPIKQNVNGTDMFPRLCEALAGAGKGVYLLGAKPGVAEAVAEWVNVNHPETKICGFHHGFYAKEEEEAVIQAIRESGAEILLVAMGAPKQEAWISQNLERTGAKVGMGVGGLFDFYSGRIPRAPQWVREIGMEWFYRFMQEPRRMWRRYFLGNFVFLISVVAERIHKSSRQKVLQDRRD